MEKHGAPASAKAYDMRDSLRATAAAQRAAAKAAGGTTRDSHRLWLDKKYAKRNAKRYAKECAREEGNEVEGEDRVPSIPAGGAEHKLCSDMQVTPGSARASAEEEGQEEDAEEWAPSIIPNLPSHDLEWEAGEQARANSF